MWLGLGAASASAWCYRLGFLSSRSTRDSDCLDLAFLDFKIIYSETFRAALKARKSNSHPSTPLPSQKYQKFWLSVLTKYHDIPSATWTTWVFPPEVSPQEQEGNLACAYFISPYRFRHTQPKTTAKTQIYWQQQDQSHLNPKACSLCLHLPWGFQEKPEAPPQALAGGIHTHTQGKNRVRHKRSIQPSSLTTAQITPLSSRHEGCAFPQPESETASWLSSKIFQVKNIHCCHIQPEKERKKKKLWTPMCPGTAQPEQPQAGSCYPRKTEFSDPPAPAARYVLDWGWKWWTCNHLSMALVILSSCSESFPAQWGWPLRLQRVCQHFLNNLS